MRKITKYNLLPDRRYMEPKWAILERRTNPCTYPSDKLIIEVPLEVQPWFNEDKDSVHYKRWMVDFEGLDISCVDEQALKEQLMELNTYQKDDILALGEEWDDLGRGLIALKSQCYNDMIDHKTGKKYTWQPASTCPISIARKVKVERVLGVEKTARQEEGFGGQPLIADESWHSIIIVEKI